MRESELLLPTVSICRLYWLLYDESELTIRYESQHNTDLPQEKLRMNTKTSVKCGCTSRVVMNEMEDGEVKAAFWWKHNGHGEYTSFLP